MHLSEIFNSQNKYSLIRGPGGQIGPSRESSRLYFDADDASLGYLSTGLRIFLSHPHDHPELECFTEFLATNRSGCPEVGPKTSAFKAKKVSPKNVQRPAPEVNMHILVIEDEPSLARFLKSSLESHEFRVDLAETETEARQKLSGQHDLILLDLKIPGVEGYELLRKARELKPFTPILILSGMNNLEDRVRGLELGADDYLSKPFALAELLARVRNLLRRASRLPDLKTCVGDLELNHMDRTVRRGGKRIDLSPKEYALLEYLMRHSGQCVTRTMIMQNVWGFSPDTMTNVVDVYISYLRRKIDDGFNHRLIHTVSGEGYEIGLRSQEEPAGLSRKAAATASHAHITGHT